MTKRIEKKIYWTFSENKPEEITVYRTAERVKIMCCTDHKIHERTVWRAEEDDYLRIVYFFGGFVSVDDLYLVW